MIFIVCDMNCNSFGNYFLMVGLENELKQDKNSWISYGNTYYPKGHCYRAKLNKEAQDMGIIRYSRAIDFIMPEDYIKWLKKRFHLRKGTVII